MGTAKWVRFQGSVKLQEQRMKNRGWRRMSFGSQLNIAISRWTLLPLWHFHPAFKSYISWTHANYLMHVIGFFFFFTTFLSDWLGPVMTLDELTTSLEAWSVLFVCLCDLACTCQITNFNRNIFPELGHLSEILKWLPLPWAGGYTKTITSTASPWRIEAAET